MQTVSCTCGQSFRAQPHLAGKTVGCPSCGQPIHVPAPTPAPTPAAESIPVRCPCGQAFAAAPHLAGTQVRCPSCQGILSIPLSHNDLSAPTSPAPMDDPLGIGSMEFAGPTLPSAVNLGTPVSARAPRRKRTGWPQSSALHWSGVFSDESTWKVGGTALVGLLMTIALPISAVMISSRILSARESASWPTAEATIDSSSIKKSRQGRRIKHDYFTPQVSYSFQVDGTAHNGTRIAWEVPGSRERSEVEAYLGQFANGTTHTVHFDPDDPSNCVLNPEYGFTIYLALIIPLICLMGPFLLYMYGMACYGRFS